MTSSGHAHAHVTYSEKKNVKAPKHKLVIRIFSLNILTLIFNHTVHWFCFISKWDAQFTLPAARKDQTKHMSHTEMVFLCCLKLTLYRPMNRPFAGSGYMVRNKLHWDTNDAVGLSKQRIVGLDW